MRRLVCGPRSVLWRLIVVFATFTLVACSDGSLRVGKPIIALSPAEIDFGSVSVGDTSVVALEVSNVGSATLVIDDVAIDVDPFSPEGSQTMFGIAKIDESTFSPTLLPLGIQQLSSGNNSLTFWLAFTPQKHVLYRSQMTLATNLEEQAEIQIPLSGQGAVPDIEVTPSKLDFGGVRLQSAASKQIEIDNLGSAPLRISAAQIHLESQRSDSPFLWVHDDLIVLNATDRSSIEVIYAPHTLTVREDGTVEPDRDVLLIESNDPDESPVRIELTGYVSDNLPPVAGITIDRITALDGSQVADLCAPAPSDTIQFAAHVKDPEGQALVAANLNWAVEVRPDSSFRQMVTNPDAFHPTFKPDLTGDYVVCLKAQDPQGKLGAYAVEDACSCADAQRANPYACPCIRLAAFPREDIRIELTWDILKPDLDLHLLAPEGRFCDRTQDCRTNPAQAQDPNWTRVACVEDASLKTCRTPDCQMSCEDGMKCFGNQCYWSKCSGSTCYWDGRNPDWGVLGDESDDPRLAIDCTSGCRVENITFNKPEPGIYTVMVNYFDYPNAAFAPTLATVRIFFRGDLEPSTEFQSRLQGPCDTWSVAQIEWLDHDKQNVYYLDDLHTEQCCE